MDEVEMGPAMREVMRTTRHAWARAYGGHLTDADRHLSELAEDEAREVCETTGVLVA
jgi:hypothetical protein